MEPLDTIITENLDSLYRYACHQTGDTWLAEDLTQETVLRAYTGYHTLQDKNAAVPWLWGILRNLLRQNWRKSREIPTEQDELVRICDGSGVSWESPEELTLRQWDIVRLRQAVAYLAGIYRQVCVAYYLEEKDISTIAEEFGIPVSSVKWRLHRSRIQLKEEICHMEFMEKSYRKAVPLLLNMGGVQHWDPTCGNYDGADAALGGLLAQNICQTAYEKPLTVTEIASSLGVAADYVEDTLDTLCKTQCILTKGNMYQTAFPIWSAEQNRLVFDGNFQAAEKYACDIVDLLYRLENDIRNVGFYGCDKDFDRLTLMLIGWLTKETEGNLFDIDNLPFHGVEKDWYILATTAKSFREDLSDNSGCVGLNTNGSSFGFVEFYISQPYFPDNRSSTTEEQRVMEALYKGDTTYVETHRTELAHLVESGKVTYGDTGYRLTVPVLSASKGEWKRLKDALSPACTLTNRIQAEINARSALVMKQVIPNHLTYQRKFFETYTTHGALLIALYRELMHRGVTITREMTTWLSVE